MNINAHSVTGIEIEDREHEGRKWVVVRILSESFRGKQVDTINCFPNRAEDFLPIAHPERATFDEGSEREPVWRDSYGHTESQRQDISDAGRGHLLP